MSLSHWLGGLWDALKEEGPSLLAKVIYPYTRNVVRRYAPRPAGGSSVIKRAIKSPRRLTSVDDRVKSMPEEWEGHKVVKRAIVFHDADRAGPHLELYIEDETGQNWNIGVKRLRPDQYEKVKYNSEGKLTKLSQTFLLSIVQDEFEGVDGAGSFLGQTTDHTHSEARHEWFRREDGPMSYGSGRMRQVLDDREITVWRMGNTIEGRDPILSPHKDFYIFKFVETERGNVVLKVGLKGHDPPKFEDRLHLKSNIGRQEFGKFRTHVGEDGIITIKEDGASTHLLLDKNGFKSWSPRHSKKTSDRIEYTHKIRDMRHLRSDTRYEMMGELLFVNERTGEVLTAHEIGGLLNRLDPIPDQYEPEIVIYRMDKVGRKSVLNEPYEQNLQRIEALVKELDDPRIRAPERIPWDDAHETSLQREGLVGVSKGDSILEGRKYKPRHDLNDWRLESVEFEPGPKGGVAGVAKFRSLDSGKEFNIGPSSVGNRETQLDMMRNSENYEGRVYKVESYRGHEGRASRIQLEHLDKGVAA